MPNGLPDPLSAVRQVGEQTAQGLSSLMSSAAQSVSQGLSALSAPLKGLQLPGLPGMNGGAIAAAPAGLLAPLVAPLQVVKDVEDVALPRGIPRPAAQLLQTVREAAQGPTSTRGEIAEEQPKQSQTVRRGGRGSL